MIPESVITQLKVTYGLLGPNSTKIGHLEPYTLNPIEPLTEP